MIRARRSRIARAAAAACCLAAVAAVALGAIACGRAAERTAGAPAMSSVWLAPGQDLGRETARRLVAAGFADWIVDEDAGTTLPPRAVVTLAVTANPSGAGRSAAWSDGFAAELGRRRLEAEARGWAVTAAHLEVRRALSSSEGESLAAVAESLRRRHGFGTVSLGLPAALLATDAEAAAKRLARGFDRVLATVYGQRPEEPDDPAAYDLQASLRRVDRLAALGRPFQARVETLGAVLGRGAPSGGTGVSLAALARHSRLRLDSGFSLTGTDRSLYRFVATGDLALAPGLRLRAREGIEVRLPLASVLLDLRGRLEARAEPRYRGLSWRRLPLPGEGLALGVSALEAVAAGRTPTLGLVTRVEWLDALGPLDSDAPRREEPRRLRVVLENPGDVVSDIAFLDSNFVELGSTGGLFGAVAPGDFQRYEFLRHGEDRMTVGAMRRPERIRLFLPALGAGETVKSGPIEWRAEGSNGRVTSEARFLVPGGGEARSGAAESRAPR